MTRLKPISWREFVRRMRELGFEGPYEGGRHPQTCPERSRRISKAYHLGQIGTGTFSRDLKLWWAKARGKPNPLLKIGDTNHGNCEGEGISV